MSHALVINGNIIREGRLPDSARQVRHGDTAEASGPITMGLRTYGTVAEREACGWFEVVDVVKPADTATDTYVRSLTLVNGAPTVAWTKRAWTADELVARTAAANRQTIGARVQTHIDALKLIKNSSGTLTGAQLSNAIRAIAAAELDVMRYLHSKTSEVD